MVTILQTRAFVKSRLEELAAMQDGWDDDGAARPSESAIHGVKAFFVNTYIHAYAHRHDILSPRIGPGPDGSVDIMFGEIAPQKRSLLINVTSAETGTYCGEGHFNVPITGVMNPAQLCFPISDWLVRNV